MPHLLNPVRNEKHKSTFTNYLDFTAPYPFLHKGKRLVISTTLILVLSFLFENLFEPFNVTPSEHRFSYWIINLIHASSASAIFFIFFYSFGNFIDEDNWKVYMEILVIAIVFFLIGVGGFLWREVIYDNPQNVSFRYFFEEVRNTFLVGTVIFFAVTGINFNVLNRQNRITAELFSPISKPYSNSELSGLEIISTVSADSFEVKPSEILCLKADGNYVEFFAIVDGRLKKKIVRLTLQEAIKQLKPFPFIIKTHRAYMINLNNVEEIEGNAQGYKLTLTGLEFKVPVSRSHLDTFNRLVGNYAGA